VPVYTLNPLDDHRWRAFVKGHPRASVFHTTEWIEALRLSYAYEPVVYTTSPPDTRLTNGILLCRVRSWLTGQRMVSVPFADHCDPLVDSDRDRVDLLAALRAATEDGCRYVELRPRTPGLWNESAAELTESFRLHELDLRPSLDDLFRRLHKSTIQRKIHRAEREDISCEEGRSDRLLRAFYRLLLMTRRRHGIPPQPYCWFANLVACMDDRAQIRVAFKNGDPIASILTLSHGDALVYKYGCSDAAVHHLGAMPFLFWRAIEGAKANGASTFDLGRSDMENAGLIAFKERLGALPRTMTYVRTAARPRRQAPRWRLRVPGQILARMPDRLFVAAGRLLYPHIG
jgi:CelD/BcsL family acetyltransferase involved in cellulose biosynthesis